MVRGFLIGAMLWLASCATASAQSGREVHVGLGFGHHIVTNGNRPYRLSDDRAAIISEGQSSTANAYDEAILVISGLTGRDVSFQQLDLYALLGEYDYLNRSLTPISEDCLLYRADTSATDPNGKLVVVKNLDSPFGLEAIVHGNLPAPVWAAGNVEVAVISPTQVVFSSPGADRIVGTADDMVLACSDLGGPNFAVTAHAPGFGVSNAVTEVGGTGTLVGYGVDGIRGTTDDVLIVVRFPSQGAPTFETVAAGAPLGLWLDSHQPLRVGGDKLVFPTTVGLGGSISGVTQAFVVVRGFPATPVATLLDAGGSTTGLAWGSPHPVAISDDALLFTGAGSDLSVGTNDDEVIVVRALSTVTPMVESYPAGMGLGLEFWARSPLSVGHFVVTGTTGADQLFASNDDGLAVIDVSAAVPTLRTVFLGSPLDNARAANDRGVWVYPSSGATGITAYITGLDDVTPSVTFTNVLNQTERPVHINDWTLLTTVPASGTATYLDDPIVVINLPYARSLEDGVGVGPLAQPPVLSVDQEPAQGLTNYEVHLSGADATSLCGLAVSHGTQSLTYATGYTSYVDWSRLITILPGQTDVFGQEGWTMHIPAIPGLSGMSLTMQAGVITYSGPLGYDLSTALEFHF